MVHVEMDDHVTAAVIGASGAILAALIGAVVGRSEFWERVFAKSRFPRLAGTRWESTWVESINGNEMQRKEIFEFTSQKRSRVYGYITMDSLPQLKWQIEGDYNDRFLRLFWQPSADAPDKFALDYGCYFFERQGRGFEGYAVGFKFETNKVEVDKHKLLQLPG